MKLLISGGGTAGHINPALAIGKYFRENHQAEVLFIGTKKGMESKLVPKEDFPIQYINVEGFIRKFTIENAKVLYKYFRSVYTAKKIIRNFSPDIVIGTGGYVCAPVLKAARKLHIPTMIHEQNVIPGVTVRLAAKSVDAVAISFEDTLKYLNPTLHHKCVVTGNPLRESMLSATYPEARKTLNIDERPMILMFGGSLGAEKLNQTMVDWINQCDTSKFWLYAGTGEKHYEGVKSKLNQAKLTKNIKVLPYIHDMDRVFPAADLVICRAGALTVSELSALGKPSILIPSPYVAHNHQEYNARSLENAGAAIMINESNLSAKTLQEAVDSIIDHPLKRAKMSENAKKLGILDATQKICKIALGLATKSK